VGGSCIVTSSITFKLNNTSKITIKNTNHQGNGSRYSDWLRAARPRGRSSSRGRVKNFSLLQVFQTGSGVHPPPIQWVPGDLSPGIKQPGREADHSPRTSAEVKKMWIYTSTPPYAFMA
jgi:hypothetical protein